MEYNFCPICAEPLLKSQGTFPHCPAGHYTQYPSQVTSVAAIVVQGESILLEQRAIEPGYALWGIPGGMMESDEQPVEACQRELLEETGYEISIKRFVTANGGKTVCAIVYEGEVVGGSLQKSDESLAVQWFPIHEIPWESMAFERHVDVLKKWLRERQNQPLSPK